MEWTKTGRRMGVQLAYPFEERRLAKWSPPFLVQPKLDGERCRAVIDADGVVTLYSSEANEILSVPHINQAIEDLGLRSLELDGELYAHGLPLETIHGIVSSKLRLHPQFEDIQLHVFDLVNEVDPQIIRTKTLFNLFAGFSNNLYELALVPITIAESYDDCLRKLDWSLDAGFEGIIVRNLEAPYIRRRSIWMMKFKPKRFDLYTIVGTTPGEGKHLGRLGAIVCQAQEGEETFHVGSGFSDSQREWFWQHRECLVGETIKVGYQHMTSARGVPRSAVFLELVSSLSKQT